MSTPTKTGTGDVRHDLEPLTKRFTALGQPIAATWMSGTLSGDGLGPSTYWIDAVVELSPETAAKLRALPNQPTQVALDLPAAVKAGLPSGPLVTSQALNDAFAQDSFRAKVYLFTDSDRLVLLALGQ